jgi:release factor glutamine methyltransferase
MRIADALALARAEGVARLDAQLLLAHRLQRPRTWLLAHDEALLNAEHAAAFRADLRQRSAGVPLAYLVGEREFHGLKLQVSHAVLVPRPETELLVDWALELLRVPGALAGRPARAVVDLGTGSGAIALALAYALKDGGTDTLVTASDASVGALAVAQANAQQLALTVEVVAGDWWLPLAGRRFDLAVSNPPYVAGDDPHLAALAHEPRAALTPEGDGLAALRSIVAGASAHLQSGGWLLLEHGFDQAVAVRQLLDEHGFGAVTTRADLAGQPRCTGGRWAG